MSQAWLSHIERMQGDFSNLIVWREAVLLAAEVQAAMPKVRGRARSNAVDQMIRAAESIAANLVEGIGRGVSQDCVRFLKIARASAMEVDHHLQAAVVSKRLAADRGAALISHTRRVRFLLRKFQESVERRLAAAA